MARCKAEFEVKDVDGAKGIISGHAAVYGNMDDGGDIIEPGAGAKTLAERGKRVKALYGHDFGKLVGHPLEIREDEKGLFTVTQIALKSFWGNEVYALAQSGALDEMSIGYATVKSTPDPDRPIRRIGEYKLYEYSFVPLAMNDQATIQSVKDALSGLNAADRAERLIAMINECAASWKQDGSHRDTLTKALDALSAVVNDTEPIATKGGESLAPLTPDIRAAAMRQIHINRLQLQLGRA